MGVTYITLDKAGGSQASLYNKTKTQFNNIKNDGDFPTFLVVSTLEGSVKLIVMQGITYLFFIKSYITGLLGCFAQIFFISVSIFSLYNLKQ